MKVEILEDGLIIVPESDFEEQYLRKTFACKKLEAFLKHGLSVKDLIGLKIKPLQNEKTQFTEDF